MTLKDIGNKIANYKSCIIMTHVSPDGDALGSCISLSLSLKKKNIKSIIVLDGEIPEMYTFLPCCENVKIFDKDIIDIDSYEALVIVDSGDIERIDKRKALFDKYTQTFNIDHHHTNTKYAKYNYVDKEASSTGEILYDLIYELGIEIDYDIAISLYVAICTDTGNFKYLNTSSKTHEVVAKLLKFDINTEEVARRVFDASSLGRLKLIKKAIENLKIYYGGDIAVMNLSKDDFNKTGVDDEEAEGLVDLVRNIKNVKIAVFIRYISKGIFRVNLRSNIDVDVSSVASKFDGGGHKKAAGCFIKGDYKKQEKKLVDSLHDLLGKES